MLIVHVSSLINTKADPTQFLILVIDLPDTIGFHLDIYAEKTNT